MLKLSIIIPIYNVEKFLPACLDSLYQQDLAESDYEIVCVIDGATDGSREVVEEYAKKHTNILLVEQENRGVSAARNNGLRRASGEYVWFVDGDDMIAPNCIGRICAELDKYQADIFEFRCQTCEENQLVIPDTDIYIYIYTDESYEGQGWLSVWSFVSRRSMLIEHRLSFNEELKYGEDALWHIQVKLHKHRHIGTNATLYYYYQRATSVTHSNDPQAIKKHRDDSLMLLAILKHENLVEDQKTLDAKSKALLKRTQISCMDSALLFHLQLAKHGHAEDDFLKQLKSRRDYPYPLCWDKLKNIRSLRILISRLKLFLYPVEPFYRILLWFSKRLG